MLDTATMRVFGERGSVLSDERRFWAIVRVVAYREVFDFLGLYPEFCIIFDAYIAEESCDDELQIVRDFARSEFFKQWVEFDAD